MVLEARFQIGRAPSRQDEVPDPVAKRLVLAGNGGPFLDDATPKDFFAQ